jgi:hypothetical protein
MSHRRHSFFPPPKRSPAESTIANGGVPFRSSMPITQQLFLSEIYPTALNNHWVPPLIPQYVLPHADNREFTLYTLDHTLNLDLRYNYADPPYYLPYHITFDVKLSIGSNPISFRLFTNQYSIDFDDSAFNFNQFTGLRVDLNLSINTDLTSLYTLTISDTSDSVYLYRQSTSFEPSNDLVLQMLTLTPTNPFNWNPFSSVDLAYMVPTI